MELGYLVDEAQHGKIALEVMRRRLPHLGVLDLHLPIMGGREFLAAVRSEPRLAAVSVVLLSGANDLLAAANDPGVRAALAKPIDLDILAAVIDRATRS